MKTDYSLYSREQLQAESRKLHKKLILPNIFILLVALVAAISLALFPLLNISVHVDENMASVIEQTMAAQPGDSEQSDIQAMADQYAFLLKDADVEVRVSVKPLDFLTVATQGREGLRTVLGTALADLPDTVDTLAEQIMPAVLTLQLASSAGVDLNAADLDAVDTSILSDTLEKLNDQDLDGAEAIFSESLDPFLAQFNVSLDDQTREQVMNSYDDFVAKATEDGTQPFSTSTFVLTMINAGASEGGAGDVFAILSDPSALADKPDDSAMQTIRLACAGVAGFIAFQAALWIILALLALLHIFIPNKKVGMWYVKLFGWMPCLLFSILPVVGLTAAPAFIPNAQQMAGIFSAINIGSFTLVSGICLLVLWIISIFWCHPVKKRIKRCKQVLKSRGMQARG